MSVLVPNSDDVGVVLTETVHVPVPMLDLVDVMDTESVGDVDLDLLAHADAEGECVDVDVTEVDDVRDGEGDVLGDRDGDLDCVGEAVYDGVVDDEPVVDGVREYATHVELDSLHTPLAQSLSCAHDPSAFTFASSTRAPLSCAAAGTFNNTSHPAAAA